MCKYEENNRTFLPYLQDMQERAPKLTTSIEQLLFISHKYKFNIAWKKIPILLLLHLIPGYSSIYGSWFSIVFIILMYCLFLMPDAMSKILTGLLYTLFSNWEQDYPVVSYLARGIHFSAQKVFAPVGEVIQHYCPLFSSVLMGRKEVNNTAPDNSPTNVDNSIETTTLQVVHETENSSQALEEPENDRKLKLVYSPISSFLHEDPRITLLANRDLENEEIDFITAFELNTHLNEDFPVTIRESKIASTPPLEITTITSPLPEFTPVKYTDTTKILHPDDYLLIIEPSLGKYNLDANSSYMSKDNSPVELPGCVYDMTKDLTTVPEDCTVTSKDGESLIVKQSQIRSKSKFWQIGPAISTCLPHVHADCPRNQLAALTGRHLTTHKNVELVNEAWRVATEEALDDIKACFKPGTMLSREDWLNTQPQSKSDMYRRNPLDHNKLVDPKFHRRAFFIKREVLVPSSINKAVNQKCPRGIQGLEHPEINESTGPFFQYISKGLANSFTNSEGSYPKFCYTSGSTPVDIGNWYTTMVAKGCYFMEDDFSAYDASQGPGCHQAEETVYTALYPGFPATTCYASFKQQANTYGESNQYRYTCKNTRKSGDQNTSVGNTILNFIAHHRAMKRLEFVICSHDPSFVLEYSMLGLGDDNLIAANIPKLFHPLWQSTVEESIKELGLQPTTKISDTPSYCSSYFVPYHHKPSDTTRYVLTPDPYRYLTKFGFTISKTNQVKGANLEKLAHVWRMQENFNSQPILQHLPIVKQFYNYYMSRVKTDKHKDKFFGEDSDNYYKLSLTQNEASEYETDLNTYNWFITKYPKFSMHALLQAESDMESFLRKYQGNPCVLDHYSFHFMAQA